MRLSCDAFLEAKLTCNLEIYVKNSCFAIQYLLVLTLFYVGSRYKVINININKLQ